MTVGTTLALNRDRAWGLALPILLGAVVIAAWQIAVRHFGVPAVILPAPSNVVVDLFGALGDLAPNARATGFEALFAFLISVGFGLVAAMLLSAFPLLFDAVYPNLVLFQLLPKIALAPLFVFWLGIGASSRLTYSVFISFFPVALATMVGLARTDANALRLCRSLGATPWQVFFAVRVPFSLPYFFSGVKVAATMSVIGIVVGEFISAREGLGYYILLAQSRGETGNIFAAILVLCLIGLAIYGLTLWAEHLVRKTWRGD
jgi:NitT/TauT family transport system permease protein